VLLVMLMVLHTQADVFVLGTMPNFHYILR